MYTILAQIGRWKKNSTMSPFSPSTVLRLAKFITVIFKYLACYALSIYFQWQSSPLPPHMLLQIFLTTKAHYLLQANHLFPQTLHLLLLHRHIVLLSNSIIIIPLQQATDSFQIPIYPQLQHHQDLNHMPAIILAIYFPHTHPRISSTDLATTQSQKAPSKLKL